MRPLLSALAIAALLPAASFSQQTQPPAIVTSSRGDVEVRPDRARLLLTVETRGATASIAGADNAKRQRAVLDELKRLGVADEQLVTAALQVTPEMVYPGQGQPPRVSGYVARNTVRVDILKIDQAGQLVDAGLAKGATGIGGLSFYSSKAAEARREALARAVAAARLDAEAMVKAAGVQLDGILEISASPSYEPPMMYAGNLMEMRAAAGPAPTPVQAGEMKVSETVTIRWKIRQ